MRVVLSVLFVCLIPFASTAEVLERIVAIVNNEIITQTDIDKYTSRLKNNGLTDDLLIPDDATKQSVLTDREKLLHKMIDERLIDSEIKRQNLQVPIERVEQEIRTIAKRNNVSREQLQSEITARGVSFSEYQDFLKTGLERQALIEKAVTSKIKLSEQDVLNHYAQTSKNASDQTYEYTLAHALFLKQKGGAEAARQRAELFLRRLKEENNFEKLAGEMSEDPNFEAGGLLGTFKTGEFIKELDLAARGLNTGEVSGVVETKTEFHVLKVLSKKLIPDPKFELEKEKIHQALYEQAYKRQLQSWLEQLRVDAFIRINQK
ncbi:MAG: peptidylprolyl isomerase [Bdellovibrionaceae bacterium]|nr:peptidylprolyl isomerase [Pseudobdellovibrionaceae bacterium]